jgi:hypothetical protein
MLRLIQTSDAVALSTESKFPGPWQSAEANLPKASRCLNQELSSPTLFQPINLAPAKT